MDTAVVTNGTTPLTNGNEGLIDRLVREIEDALAPLDARRERLEAELLDLNEERQRLQAGIAGLTGALVPRAGEEPPKKKPAKPPSEENPRRYASQKTLDDIYAFIATADRELTSIEIREGTGYSESVTHGAIRMLRDAERIRITGTRRKPEDGRAGGKPPATYAVMP